MTKHFEITLLGPRAGIPAAAARLLHNTLLTAGRCLKVVDSGARTYTIIVDAGTTDMEAELLLASVPIRAGFKTIGDYEFTA